MKRSSTSHTTEQRQLTESSIWLYLAISLCKVLSIIIATIPDKKNTITTELRMLTKKIERRNTAYVLICCATSSNNVKIVYHQLSSTNNSGTRSLLANSEENTTSKYLYY